jgi:hypothetical protein
MKNVFKYFYNYIAHLHEITPWNIDQFVYVGIVNFWYSIVNGLGSP